MAFAYHLRFVPLLLVATGCAKHAHPPQVPAGVSVTVAPDDGVSTDWKALILPEDSSRIALIETTWSIALAQARDRHFGKAIEAEGPLLDPKVALIRPAPSPGRYRCRTFKLGVGEDGKGVGFARFKPFYCFVQTEGPLLILTKATGTQRPGGRLWDDGEKRMVFMGGVAESSGEPPAYAPNAKQNRVGVVERVDDFRWRFVTPGQSADARIEVMELVPDVAASAERVQ